MRHATTAIAVGVVHLAVLASANASLVNVALGKTVASIGPLGGSSASLSTLTDGVFLGRGTQWQTGTVWWGGPETTIVIGLGDTYSLVGATVQADDNDAYILEYHDLELNEWRLLWAVPNFDQFGWGMQTRPNPADDSAVHMFEQSVLTDAIRFRATPGAGDTANSVSEIQVFAVPAPGAVAFVALGALGARRRRH